MRVVREAVLLRKVQGDFGNVLLNLLFKKTASSLLLPLFARIVVVATGRWQLPKLQLLSEKCRKRRVRPLRRDDRIDAVLFQYRRHRSDLVARFYDGLRQDHL